MKTETQSAQAPKLITLNCSGGISLGAYMAGVFYELTKESVKSEPKVIIDIITGSSAGAMSGVIAAYCLLQGKVDPPFQSNQLLKFAEEEHKSPLYQAWVQQADIQKIDSFSVMFSSFKDGFQATIESFTDSFEATIERYKRSSNPLRRGIHKLLHRSISSKLTPEAKRKKTTLSVLSGEAIEKIAELVIKPPQITENTKPLALLMTLTNLQGILEEINLTDSQGNLEQEIETITSSETRQFLFHAGIPQEKMNKMWGKAVMGGRASGAFPVAFPPIWDHSDISSINLKDLSDDYFKTPKKQELKEEGLGAVRESIADNTHLVFLYTDGGILDGLPILKGIELENNLRSKQIPNNERSSQFQEKFTAQQPSINTERLHVYIRPVPVENLNSAKRLTQGQFSTLEVGLSGLTLPKAEHDSLRLREIQEQNQLALAKRKLLEAIEKKNLEDMNQVKQIIEEAIPYRHIKLRPITPAILGEIANSESSNTISKLKPIYDNLPKNIKNSLQEGSVAELLASDFLGAFGGFFDKRYRDHDFLLGRICGITWLHQYCDVEITEAEVDTIVRQSKKYLLERDPQPSDLKLSQKIRIARIVLRALRIVLTESKIIGLMWLFVFGILKVLAISGLAILEILATLLIVVSDLMEKSQKMMFGNQKS
ncbi:patatin-like phospholipase family protein [Coleofasciculus sp. FACHB-1120]|uniref:patatin-like phospholipase family protein n=1 Tax=Coleofasciculus sp. FACHB-1120 TaxID=2692783 RepID=UPI0016858B22|nr:patatin-like phospholipase family protein [Coleofasciculus sp. FACHB-1120]MBD2740794.1 patatin-like phospholipase family protein [Coleofasciculus sp. FACHB-1120]